MKDSAEALAEFGQAAKDAMKSIHYVMREAGVLPEEPPTDPKARALWLRRCRSTGPKKVLDHRLSGR